MKLHCNPFKSCGDISLEMPRSYVVGGEKAGGSPKSVRFFHSGP